MAITNHSNQITYGKWKEVNFLVDEGVHKNHLNFNFRPTEGFSLTDGENKESAILDYYLNHGYPFTTIKLSDVKIDNSEIIGTCLLNPKQKVVWDSTSTRGNVIIHTKFIENYLGVKVRREI